MSVAIRRSFSHVVEAETERDALSVYLRQIYSKDETFRAMVQYLPCKSERTAEDLRTELAQARSEARDAAVAQAEGRARLEAQSASLADRLAAAGQTVGFFRVG
ncbi:hypothetical protein D3C72_1284920 [compost metagenome]